MIKEVYNEGFMGTAAVAPQSTNAISECKYCGREFMHSNGTRLYEEGFAPMVELYSLDPWNQKLVTSVHDARLPLNCPSCGADVYLNSNREETKRYNIKGTEGTGTC